jgi:succinate dehydrogenase/fumarate reductase-like Fe-S protein
MDKGWIQEAFASAKKKGTLGRCTGDKFGSSSCPKGSPQYNMAKNLRTMAAKKVRSKEK